jgi:hypothetical protein
MSYLEFSHRIMLIDVQFIEKALKLMLILVLLTAADN